MPKRLQWFQIFSVSQFQIFSKSAADFGHDRCENTDKFVRFLVQSFGSLAGHTTILHEKFKPELRFIRLSEQPIQLGTKLRVRARS